MAGVPKCSQDSQLDLVGHPYDGCGGAQLLLLNPHPSYNTFPSTEDWSSHICNIYHLCTFRPEGLLDSLDHCSSCGLIITCSRFASSSEISVYHCEFLSSYYRLFRVLFSWKKLISLTSLMLSSETTSWSVPWSCLGPPSATASLALRRKQVSDSILLDSVWPDWSSASTWTACFAFFCFLGFPFLKQRWTKSTVLLHVHTISLAEQVVLPECFFFLQPTQQSLGILFVSSLHPPYRQIFCQLHGGMFIESWDLLSRSSSCSARRSCWRKKSRGPQWVRYQGIEDNILYACTEPRILVSKSCTRKAEPSNGG